MRENNDTKKVKIIFRGNIVVYNNKPALMIRTFVNDSKIIEEIVEKMMKDGYYDFNGRLVFKSPLISIISLINSGLISEEQIQKIKKRAGIL